jgi:hypothetical protein
LDQSGFLFAAHAFELGEPSQRRLHGDELLEIDQPVEKDISDGPRLKGDHRHFEVLYDFGQKPPLGACGDIEKRIRSHLSTSYDTLGSNGV